MNFERILAAGTLRLRFEKLPVAIEIGTQCDRTGRVAVERMIGCHTRCGRTFLLFTSTTARFQLNGNESFPQTPEHEAYNEPRERSDSRQIDSHDMAHRNKHASSNNERHSGGLYEP